MTDERALADRLREGVRLVALEGDSEAATRQRLIGPVIAWLGYDDQRVRWERHDAGNRPDYLLYADPITEGGPAQAVVEAKPLDADFDRVTATDRTESPDRQIRRYLRDHAESGPGTVGALTDGLRWRIYRKEPGGGIGAEPLDIDIGPLVRGGHDSLEALESLREALARVAAGAPGGAGERSLRAIAAAVRNGNSEDALSALGAVSDTLDPIAAGSLTGRDLDGFTTDWEEHGHAEGVAIDPRDGQQNLFGPPRVRIAAVRFRPEERGVGRGDAARAARIFATRTEAAAAVTLVWQAEEDGSASVRVVAAVGRNVAMTQPFDPDLPPPTARDAAARVLGLLAAEPLRPQALLDALDVLPLQRDFYEEIRRWLRRVRRDAAAFGPGAADGDRHEVLLRHLIRVLFVWIMKEEGSIPRRLFDRSFPLEYGIEDYHGGVLRFLFHRRLNTQEQDRAPHPQPGADIAFASAPFLNGSLFEVRPGDAELRLAGDAYWSDGDERAPGLFDILGRYHWTADEQRPGEREQTLDPELLSNLFEQLLADPLLEEKEVRGGTETLKAPDGAYYTPMDVTAEMAADALAAAVRDLAPAGLRDAALLDLFRDPDAPLPPNVGGGARERLALRIAELRVFDPAVGSGAFLLAVLQALRTAHGKLRPDDHGDPTRGIVTRQLMGQDINPMAAQIARLRLFVALQAAERRAERRQPLPNLEARIVCADTLRTHPQPGYDPFARPNRDGDGAQATLAGANGGLRDAVRRLMAVREEWPGDHTEEDKASRREQDRQARDRLRGLIDGDALAEGAGDELRALADYPLLEPDHDEAALIDPRLLFAQDEARWQGFDVVIGNPPYQSFAKSGIGRGERADLEARGYRALRAGDLYALFCEAALALARPDGGAVSLVVPLSLAFGRSQSELRAIFSERCEAVSVRHYDNIPDTIFNAHPLFKGWKNSQRASIVTAVRGDGPASLRTDALLRWPVAARGEALQRRRGLLLPGADADSSGAQWPRIPSEAVAEMVHAIRGQHTRLADVREREEAGAYLSLPPTGRYFASALPPGIRYRGSQWLLGLPDDETRLLAIAALNGHVAYGWLRAFGDGFHVKVSDYADFTIPDSWIDGDDREEALRFGRRLVEAIPASRSDKLNAGVVWPNVDFYQQEELIEELDRFHIESLGLDPDALLPTLRRMRSPDGWDFG